MKKGRACDNPPGRSWSAVLLEAASIRSTGRRCKPISTQASVTRSRPDCTRNSTSRRLNSCLLIDNTATAHLPGPQNPGVCHLYLAEGCHLYTALTDVPRILHVME